MEELKTFYRAFREYREMLTDDDAHRQIMRALQSGAASDDVFSSRLSRCELDEEWIRAIEAALPYVERALDEQRRFIQSNEEIRRVDQAKKTSVESIRHLAQHSNMISHIENGDVVPDRVLIVERDDNYAIYENRFLYTLVTRLQLFLDERYNAVADLNGANAFSYTTERDVTWNRRHLKANVQISYEQRSTKPRNQVRSDEMTCLERVALLRMRVGQLSCAPLMKLLKGVTPVSAPIVRTNVFKKNDNFKRALELFEFLEGYRKPGYEIIVSAADAEKPAAEFRNHLSEVIALEAFVGMLASDAALREALEANFLHENELAEQERIRLEEERERQVQARIQAARDEEIEIRKIEVAKREAVIAEKIRIIEKLEEALAECRNRVQNLTCENAELKADIARKDGQIAALEAALSESRSRCNDLCKQIETLSEMLDRTKAKAQQELDALRNTHAEEIAKLKEEHHRALDELKDSLEKQRSLALQEAHEQAQKQLSENDLSWQNRMQALEQKLTKQCENALAGQKRDADQRENALRKQLDQARRREDNLQTKLDRTEGQLKKQKELERQLSQYQRELRQKENLQQQNEKLLRRIAELESGEIPSGMRRLFRRK